MVEEAVAASRLVECELLQCGKPDPFPRRRGGWHGYVEEANVDEFEQRTPSEKGRQIMNGHVGRCLELKPREGGEGENAKIRVEIN